MPLSSFCSSKNSIFCSKAASRLPEPPKNDSGKMCIRDRSKVESQLKMHNYDGFFK